MSTILKWIGGLIFLILSAAIFVAVMNKQFRFNEIELGMKQADALALIGEAPRWQEEQLGICKDWPDKPSWLGDCKGAVESSSKLFLIWTLRHDTYHVIGIDDRGDVVFKSSGDCCG